MTKQELLAVLDMSEDEQREKVREILATNDDWKHSYCLWEGTGGDSPMVECDKCNKKELRKGKYNIAPWEEPLRIGKCSVPDPLDDSLADLAFRLSGGKIAGKKPIEHIIDALIKDLDR